MKFFTDKGGYTHRGSFYAIPIYLNLDEEDIRVEGTNILLDKLLVIALYFHSYVIEWVVQTFTSIFNIPYESGFPFCIKKELPKVKSLGLK